MRKPIQISIPSPCHEDWQRMTPVDKGRFCDSCQTKVYDFIGSSDREIVSVLAGNKVVCGRLSVNQMNRDLVVPKEKSKLWIATSAAIMSFVVLQGEKIYAQTPVATEQHESDNPQTKCEVLPQRALGLVVGVVSDEVGPLPGATIIIKGKEVSIQSDLEGRFSIEAVKGDLLIFSYTGYDLLEVEVLDSEINPVLKPTELQIVGLIKTRTFFGRIFYRIGNLFR